MSCKERAVRMILSFQPEWSEAASSQARRVTGVSEERERYEVLGRDGLH